MQKFMPLEPLSCNFIATLCIPASQLHLACLRGFGSLSPNRTAAHDRPSPFLVIYFYWPLLNPLERSML